MNPWIVSPSSVRVPVLSNTMRLTLPATFTLGGEIQKILFSFNLEIEYTVPIVMAEGRIGGTVIVIKSKHFIAIYLLVYPASIRYFTVEAKPKTDRKAINPTK